MTDRLATARGYADSVAIATANTGSGTPFDIVSPGGGTILATASPSPLKGTRAYRFSPDAVSTCTVAWNPPPVPTGVGAVNVALSGYPSATCQLIRGTAVGGGGTAYFSINVNPTGGLQIANAANTVVFTSDATVGANVLSLNTDYRIEYAISNGTGTTDTLVLQVYAADSSSIIAGLSTTVTGNFSTLSVGRIIYGKSSAAVTIAPFMMLDLRYSDGVTTLLGPTAFVDVVPASGTIPFTVTVTTTFNSGTGATRRYDWDWGDGSTTPPQAGNTATHSYTTASSGVGFTVRGNATP